MRNNLYKIATAAIALAITFTLSCSGDDGGGDNPGSSSPSVGGDGSSSSITVGEVSSSSGGGASSSSGGGGGGSSSSATGGSGIVHGAPVIYQNETYETVVIGEQTWMVKNLNYDVPGNDTDVCYDNDPANCTIYGRLYDWATAMTACPTGWHIPSIAEVRTLEDFAGGGRTADIKLKATSGWDSSTRPGTDDYGFAALPGGRGFPFDGGDFYFVGGSGYWWSATEYGDSNAGFWYISKDEDGIERSNVVKSGNLFSVRCIKDN